MSRAKHLVRCYIDSTFVYSRCGHQSVNFESYTRLLAGLYCKKKYFGINTFIFNQSANIVTSNTGENAEESGSLLNGYGLN